jgi:hypothetical protein
MSAIAAGLLGTGATAGAASGAGLGLPTRSEIEGWIAEVNDLSSSSAAYRAAAENIEITADRHARQLTSPGGTEWTGDAADTAQESGYADRGVVYRAADHMRATAKVANLGAQNLSQARDRALDAISEAEADDFHVGDDLSVIDRRRYSSHEISLYMARKAKAEEHHGYIAMRAGTLASEDAEVGGRLNAGATTLDAMIPQHWNKHGGAAPQLVPLSIEWVGPPPPEDGPMPAISTLPNLPEMSIKCIDIQIMKIPGMNFRCFVIHDDGSVEVFLSP